MYRLHIPSRQKKRFLSLARRSGTSPGAARATPCAGAGASAAPALWQRRPLSSSSSSSSSSPSRRKAAVRSGVNDSLEFGPSVGGRPRGRAPQRRRRRPSPRTLPGSGALGLAELAAAALGGGGLPSLPATGVGGRLQLAHSAIHFGDAAGFPIFIDLPAEEATQFEQTG